VLVFAPGDSDIGRIVDENDCGVRVDPGSPGALAAAVRRLSSYPERTAEMGRRVRELFEERFSRERGISEFDAVIQSVAGSDN
jgi:glycosyltransferase involved in cell wall biosynthesis